MRRRQAIPSVIGLIGLPGIARAQPAQAPGKIGYLHPRSIAPDSSTGGASREPGDPNHADRRDRDRDRQDFGE